MLSHATAVGRVASPPSPSVLQKTCPVCAEGNKKLLSGASCGHVFCQECWKIYIETQISSGKAVGEYMGGGS